MRIRSLCFCSAFFLTGFLCKNAMADEVEKIRNLEKCVKTTANQSSRNTTVDGDTQFVFNFSFVVSNFPLGKFCGEFLPEYQKDDLQRFFETRFDKLEACFNDFGDVGAVTLQIAGGGFSDAVEFASDLDIDYPCQSPPFSPLDLFKFYANVNDHIKLGLLRMLMTENIFRNYFVDYLKDRKEQNKHFTKDRIVWKGTEFIPHEQDLREGPEFRRAEFEIRISFVIFTPKVIELPPSVPTPEQKIESKPKPIKLQESSCRFKIGARLGAGVLSPLIGDARNTFGISPFVEIDLPISYTCIENWSLSPAVMAAGGYHSVPYEGEKEQVFFIGGAGLRLRRHSQLWDRNFALGGEARWMYLSRDIKEVGGQYSHSLFVGPNVSFWPLFSDLSVGIELRAGMLGLEINHAFSPNAYGEALIVIPIE